MEYYLVIAAVTLVVLGVVLVGIVESRNRARTFRESCVRLAAQYSGTFQAGGLFRWPGVRFVYRGTGVLVDMLYARGWTYDDLFKDISHHKSFHGGRQNEPHYTQINIQGPDPGLRCEIYPATRFLDRLGKLLGVKDIEVGSPQFDADYQISGNSPEAIRELLSPAAQAVIDALRGLTNDDEIYILISGGVLLVRKQGILHNYDDLQRFVALSLELFDQALLTRPSGIKFIDGPPGDQGFPICQVCGDPIIAEFVQCRTCQTPHHRECWTYFGACSTYGCGEKRFATPRATR